LKKYLQNLAEEFDAARPEGGRLPASELEWGNLQTAAINLNAELLRQSGVAKADAIKLSQLIYGDRLGRLVLACILKRDRS
jgi:hypothetical protein